MRRVTFAEGEIPILAVEHLIMCKVVFDRPKDWVDLDAIMADARGRRRRGVALGGECRGDVDPRYDRIAACSVVNRETEI